jgi:hypothetical protein
MVEHAGDHTTMGRDDEEAAGSVLELTDPAEVAAIATHVVLADGVELAAVGQSDADAPGQQCGVVEASFTSGGANRMTRDGRGGIGYGVEQEGQTLGPRLGTGKGRPQQRAHHERTQAGG